MSRCGTTREETAEEKRCISIDLGSAQDIIEIRTGSSSRVSDVPRIVATAWSECNVIPGGSPALFPKLLILCILQKPADGQAGPPVNSCILLSRVE